MNFGTKFLLNNRIEFNFWAPDSKTVDLCVKNLDEFDFIIPMKSSNNWFQLITDHVKIGSKYQFRIESGLMVPDPASRFQADDVHGPSIVINPHEFNWENDYKWNGRPWNEAVIYEIHTGTFSKEGTFKAVEEKLDYIASLGITAIELMPVSAFPGKRNWGYDGVLSFAPNNTYGTPEDLKQLIKTAHKKGLMVFLDVVYNHFGPEGNYLHVYAKSQFFNSKEKTPWGDSINFENKNVRNFFIQNALYWLEEYHFDGLRLDAIHTIKDNSNEHILNEIARAIKEKIKDRHVHLILENDNNEAKYLKENFCAQWNDDFHHAMHVLLTGEKSGYYEDYSEEKSTHKSVYYLARSMAEGFAYQGEKSAHRSGKPRGENSKNLLTTSFINFLQNHDQIGNRFLAQRINKIASPEALKAAVCIYLLSPSIPMMFMGEEFSCEQPFFFFCNFEGNLAKAVKEGRLKEFSDFSDFVSPPPCPPPQGGGRLTSAGATPQHPNAFGFYQCKIPDATSEEAFMESKIDWEQLKNTKHRETFDFYRKMLEIRKKHIIPLIPKFLNSHTHFEVISDSLFFVRWKIKNGESLELLANMGDKELYCNKNFSGKLIAESQQNSFQQFKEQKIITNWGVYWFLDENNKKTTT